jgi:hypothetical protein
VVGGESGWRGYAHRSKFLPFFGGKCHRPHDHELLTRRSGREDIHRKRQLARGLRDQLYRPSPLPPLSGMTAAPLPPAIAAAIVDPIEFAALRNGSASR